MLLKKNPKGGKPMTGYGAISYDESSPGFQYKLGYCRCGKAILATPKEIGELATAFRYLAKRRNVVRSLAITTLRKLADQ